MKVVLIGGPDRETAVDIIYAACRQCYSPGFVGDDYPFENVSRFKKQELIQRVINSGHHCYDKDTEVLTDRGFKLWPEVTMEDKLAVFDPDDGNLVGFENPKELICDDYDGLMYHFKSPHKLDLMVTPGHRLYCSLSRTQKLRRNPVFEIHRANEIIENQSGNNIVAKRPMRFKCFSESSMSGVYNPLDLPNDKIISFCKLVGFFIGDGHYVPKLKNWMCFHLLKERKIEYLRKITSELGFELHEKPNNRYDVMFPGLGLYSFDLYDSNGEKNIPYEILYCSKDIINAVLDGLINSDGIIPKKQPQSLNISTTSKQVANMIHMMFLFTGYSSKIDVVTHDKEKHPKWNDCYYVYRCSRAMPRVNDNPKFNNFVKEEKYCGKIYCASVSTGLLMVRRNNHYPVLSGNSTIEHVAYTFAIEDLSRGGAQQLTRHRLANFSIQSTRYNNVENMGVWKAPSIKNNETISKEYDDFVKTAAEFYKHLIDNGIPKEDARDVLPLALNSNIVMTMNCRELIHFFGLRLCTKAQKEIRDLAKEMLKLCKERLPEVFENIGPKCKQIGYCNEGKRSCGLMPLKEDVFRIYSEHKSSN